MSDGLCVQSVPPSQPASAAGRSKREIFVSCPLSPTLAKASSKKNWQDEFDTRVNENEDFILSPSRARRRGGFPREPTLTGLPAVQQHIGWSSVWQSLLLCYKPKSLPFRTGAELVCCAVASKCWCFAGFVLFRFSWFSRVMPRYSVLGFPPESGRPSSLSSFPMFRNVLICHINAHSKYASTINIYK